MASPLPNVICGEPTGYPQPICTLPPGHDGAHTSEIIPEELADAAAHAVRARDEAHAERDRLRELNGHLERRMRFVYRVSIVLIVLAAVNGVSAAIFLFSGR